MENTKKKLKKTPNVYHFPIESPAELRKHLCKPAELHSFIRILFPLFLFECGKEKCLGKELLSPPQLCMGFCHQRFPGALQLLQRQRKTWCFVALHRSHPQATACFRAYCCLKQSINNKLIRQDPAGR